MFANLLVIPGIGTEKNILGPQELYDSLTGFFWEKNMSAPYHYINYTPVNWQAVVEPTQRKIRDCSKDLGFKSLRNLLISFGGDALSYSTDSDTYKDIHKRVEVAIRDSDPDLPLVVVGHSLGSIIAMNFIWDCQNPDGQGSKKSNLDPKVGEYVRKHLKSVITLGSPYAILVSKYKENAKPIELGQDQRWINIYSPKDIIAYPVKNINANHNIPKITDLKIPVGSLLTRYTPLSHLGYWEDRRVVEIVANECLRAINL